MPPPPLVFADVGKGSFMRTFAALLLVLATTVPTRAQQPPHAFLFGAWAGGLYPVLNTQVEQACRSDPTFTVQGDVVRRVALASGAVEQRVIATVRPVPNGVDITFAPQAGTAGFGCETPDILHVRRAGADEISFPGCADYPEPLVKCR